MGRVEKVLAMAGATVQSRAMMYKAVVQTVLLYGRESWVVTNEMLKVLVGFHHRFYRQITGMTNHQVREGGWEWSSAEETLEAAALWPMKE